MRAWGACVLTMALASPALLAPGCAFSELQVAECGGFQDVEASCDACMRSTCCAQAEACRASASCSQLFDCLKACGDAAECRSACAAAFPSDDTAAALSACRTELCGDGCTNCGGFYRVASPACDDCTRVNCCAEATACFEDATCTALSYCQNDRDHPRGGAYCDAQHGESQLNRTFGACLHQTCGVACQLGARFDCVGSFQYPPPVADVVTYQTRLFRISNEFGEGEPLGGATFRACSRVDGECASPVAQTTLDGEGSGSLQLPAGFDAYFETSGVPDVPGELRFNDAQVLTDEHWSFGLYTTEQIDDAHALLGVDRLADRGLIFAFPKDCDETEAPGIRLELAGSGVDSVVVPFYFESGFPNTELTETKPGPNQGGGFANVTPGLYTVRGFQVSTGREVVSAQVLVRAGWTTAVHVLPSP